MSGYADELLNDFGSDDDEQDQKPAATAASNGDSNGKRKWEDDLADLDDGDDDGDDDVDPGERVDENSKLKLGKDSIAPSAELRSEDIKDLDFGPESVPSVSSISTLLSSSKVQATIARIEHFKNKASSSASSSSSTEANLVAQMQVEGILEHSEEYQLIVRANNLAVEVENEITLVHKFIRDHYNARFPELDTVIPRAWEHVRAVEALGNPDDLSAPKEGSSLESLLPRELVVPISIAASTTSGKKLSQQEWDKVQEGCKTVHELARVTRLILEYVESRMSFIAPNLSALVGSNVATKLLGVAGGLTALSKIPACNIQVLGAAAKKASLGALGLSSNLGGNLSGESRHVGFIDQAPLMSEVPPEYHRQAVRLISAKVALVSRMDVNHSEPLGTYGSKLRAELSQKIEKLLEAAPAKMVKALPVPVEGNGHKKRRGGRRARKMKELYGASELRKLQNRVEFGKAEEEMGAFDETVGLGMAGSSSASGRIRAGVGENRTKAKMSKKNQGRLEAIRRGNARTNLDEMLGPSSSSSSFPARGAANGISSSATSSGTQTSLAFTPVQGIELADPTQRARKVDEANDKWFRQGQFSLLPGVKGGATPLVPSSGTVGQTGGKTGLGSGPGSGSMGPPAAPRR
ncbi:Nop domain-containing protein [Microstroma glucosiphilum]|uniref:Nop domain-containing protein n=1 Tax=Pseudomicrostroma glucosiphilum TaxID=1684307 RepID=A0A316TYY4_9BASI|nr:Nop domain-containing protein [Pseudomicrostroma glucosiphilum]PWN18456.1 Nop domain-containing protein [Pseudomicrostroma glucosiphilum]